MEYWEIIRDVFVDDLVFLDEMGILLGLKQFVHINKGKLQILSHEGCATIDEKQEIYENRQSFFGGTLVNITLLCNESYYALELEPDDEPLF